jgi:hypothetical protein
MTTKSKKTRKSTNQNHRDPFPEPRTIPGKWDTSGMSSPQNSSPQGSGNPYPEKDTAAGDNPASEDTFKKDTKINTKLNTFPKGWDLSELTSWYNR